MFVLASLSRVPGTLTSTFAQIVFFAALSAKEPRRSSALRVFFFFSSKQQELNRRGKQRVERVEEVNGQGDGIWTAATAGIVCLGRGSCRGTTGDNGGHLRQRRHMVL